MKWMNWMKWNEMKRKKWNEMKWNGMEWNEWMNDWLNEWRNEWMNKWTNECQWLSVWYASVNEILRIFIIFFFSLPPPPLLATFRRATSELAPVSVTASLGYLFFWLESSPYQFSGELMLLQAASFTISKHPPKFAQLLQCIWQPPLALPHGPGIAPQLDVSVALRWLCVLAAPHGRRAASSVILSRMQRWEFICYHPGPGSSKFTSVLSMAGAQMRGNLGDVDKSARWSQ